MTRPDEPSCPTRHRITLAQAALIPQVIAAICWADGWAIPALVGLPLVASAAWGLGYDHHRNHRRRPCGEGL